jgi:uncharacterized protein
MVRPRNCRRVGHIPRIDYFKPRGIPLAALEEVVLSIDELEAVRLADLEGLYQERAAEMMNVSRQTFGRIIESAHKKVAEALIQGKALKIEGGEFEIASMRRFKCEECHHSWEIPYGMSRPRICPSCESLDIDREQENRAHGRKSVVERSEIKKKE